ncbi:DNA-binding protein [Aquabacterium sp. J223]|uniref:helix-turn-helix domain-containing transcriptional regulator n=1 Tax=Aquabacterium sp. J223 TaxID=2898431 RepID=UPI0021AD970B|nr:transcriptional regulator [Aquabacterium sp. J223]UUX96603.1 transcriptional regulator [Aquabacterium sp. J223]
MLARVQVDPKFHDSLLKEGIETALFGEVDTGKAILRDYSNKATVGFEQLAAKTGLSTTTLIRMLGPTGNPQTRNLFSVIRHLQRHAGLTLHVAA